MKLKTRVVGFGTLIGIATLYLVLSVVVRTPLDTSGRAENPINQLDRVSNLVGHLNVMRKDLDISNSTGDSSSLKEAISISNLSDSQLMEYLMHSEAFKKKDIINSILRVAHTIEKYQQQLANHKPLNEEFVPDQEEEAVRTGEGRDGSPHRPNPGHHVGHPQGETGDKLADINPDSIQVTLDPGVKNDLSKIVEVMATSHRKKKRRRGPMLNMYPEGCVF